jgi:hypothetical protein
MLGFEHYVCALQRGRSTLKLSTATLAIGAALVAL